MRLTAALVGVVLFLSFSLRAEELPGAPAQSRPAPSTDPALEDEDAPEAPTPVPPAPEASRLLPGRPWGLPAALSLGATLLFGGGGTAMMMLGKSTGVQAWGGLIAFAGWTAGPAIGWSQFNLGSADSTFAGAMAGARGGVLVVSWLAVLDEELSGFGGTKPAQIATDVNATIWVSTGIVATLAAADIIRQARGGYDANQTALQRLQLVPAVVPAANGRTAPGLVLATTF